MLVEVSSWTTRGRPSGRRRQFRVRLSRLRLIAHEISVRRTHQTSRFPEANLQRPQCPDKDQVKCLHPTVPLPGPNLFDEQVGQPEFRRQLSHEPCLLAGRIDGPHAPVGSAYRHRHGREARPRAHVDHPRSAGQLIPGQHLEAGKRIEEMAHQHPLPVGDGSQVKAPVPIHQLPVADIESRQVMVGECNMQILATCNQSFH